VANGRRCGRTNNYRNQTFAYGAVNGQLSKGTITSADLQEPLAGKHKYDLVNLLKNGGVYINVHTSKNQDGEIRGQVS
jgi:CHRD domain